MKKINILKKCLCGAVSGILIMQCSVASAKVKINIPAVTGFSLAGALVVVCTALGLNYRQKTKELNLSKLQEKKLQDERDKIEEALKTVRLKNIEELLKAKEEHEKSLNDFINSFGNSVDIYSSAEDVVAGLKSFLSKVVDGDENYNNTLKKLEEYLPSEVMDQMNYLVNGIVSIRSSDATEGEKSDRIKELLRQNWGGSILALPINEAYKKQKDKIYELCKLLGEDGIYIEPSDVFERTKRYDFV